MSNDFKQMNLSINASLFVLFFEITSIAKVE